jgi:hypothetical protein
MHKYGSWKPVEVISGRGVGEEWDWWRKLTKLEMSQCDNNILRKMPKNRK